MFLILSRFEISKKKIRFFETAKVDDPLNQIKNVCNIASILKAVKELRINLETCKIPLEKFQAFTNIAENFGNHG